MANALSYREGGWGWVAVFSAFLAELIVYGSLKAFGVLITSMKEDFQTNLWIVGSICALHFGVQFVLTPLATAAACQYRSRVVITLGGVLYGFGLVISSVVQNIVPFAVFLILIAGSGAACTLETTRAEVAFYFQEKYAVASFLALAGGPIGMMLYGPVTQVLLETYGWRGALLLIGGTSFHLICSGLLVRRPTRVYAKLLDDCTDPGPDNGPSSSQTDRCLAKLSKVIAGTLGLDLFLCLDFLLLAAVRLFTNACYGGILVYMVPNGLAVGLSPSEAALLTTVFGVGSLAGLSLTALVLHTEVLSCHATGAIAGCMTVVALALDTFISTPIGHMANTCIIGAGIHSIIQVTSVLTRGLPYGDDRFVVVLGWQSFLAGVATSGGDTLSGWLYGATQSFHGTFFMYSAFMTATVLFLLVDFIRAFITTRRRSTL
ncbi:monocarboxylate transporter 13-like [Patiria miniata]|uniref:Uncharacterized protein n=1 Tax=Patiria miniata TaxID=46514 RepID=A0A913Z3H1_PATMI|nr:monocarboxylate transporter 13-like [Patiria miniata]XP_038046377.1 monocarboxylate transporter 13-like [Patiria miniata]XP_038046378.1 monocarboxylate transporter 13-like [Patiria miniata]